VPTLKSQGVAVAIGAVVIGAGPTAATAAAKVTHKVTIKAELVNNWTVEDDRDCGPIGGGTLTAKFHTVAATRVLPYVDDYAGGGWNVGVPYGYKGRLITAMDYAKVAGTVTRVDDTTPRPPADPTDPCPPLSKRGCGTFPLPKKSGAYVYGGHRPRHISLHANVAFGSVDCLIGGAETFDTTPALAGGDDEGNVLIKMPKPSAFKRRLVRVKGTTHKKTSWGNAEEGRSTEDITRKVTVTFRRL